MKKFKVRATYIAKNQVVKITNYLKNELKSIQAAEGFLDDFYSCCKILGDSPYTRAVLDIPELKPYEIRCFALKKYVLFFRIHQDENEVVIVAVLHGLQDRTKLLKELLAEKDS